MARLEPRDHTISLKTAAAYTKAHRGSLKNKEGGADHAGAFHAEQVMKLLQQKGCKALRVYHGKNEKGERAMVLVAVDEKGNDMTSGIMMEMCWPCPPFCSDPNELNS